MASVYLKSDFLFDFIATIPSILLSKNHSIYLLRLFHIHEIAKAKYPLQVVIGKLMPNSRIGRLNLTLTVEFFYFIFMGVHFVVCLWEWTGER